MNPLPRVTMSRSFVQQMSDGDTIEEAYLVARVYQALSQKEAARAAYLKALSGAPERLDWRRELAEVLYQDGRLSEARAHLLIILSRRPQDDAAKSLLTAVSAELRGR